LLRSSKTKSSLTSARNLSCQSGNAKTPSALSRARELRADAYAVRLTGGADAFVTSMRRLAQTNLVDDQPPRLARVLSSHPPVRDRVMAALRQAERGTAAPSAAAGRHG